MKKSEIKKISYNEIGEEYFYFKHKSGLEVYIYPKPFSLSSAVIGTKFGSSNTEFITNDGVRHTVTDGVAHFLEHKLFENADGEDTFEKYSRHGAEGNAFTSSKATCYLFSATDGIYESLEILLKTVFEPYFTEENVKKEQGIIKQEVLMNEDDVYNDLYYSLLDALYYVNPAKIRTVGTVESVMSITPENLYECYNAFYTPSNMVLCVCGKYEIEKTVSIIDKVISDKGFESVTTIFPEEPDEVCHKQIIKYRDISKPMFSFGIKQTPEKNAYKRLKTDTLCEIALDLIFGHASDFYDDVYNTSLVSNDFGAGCFSSDSFSYISFSGESPDPEKVYEKICEYAKKGVKNPPSEKRFERARKSAYSLSIKGLDYPKNLCEDFVYSKVADGVDYLDTINIFKEISYADFTIFLKTFFDEQKMCKVIIYPKEEKND